MLKWWELAIPVAGTLGGVISTIGAQAFAGKRQRKHERHLRVADDKRKAYVQFCAHINLLSQLDSEQDSLQESLSTHGLMLRTNGEQRQQISLQIKVLAAEFRKRPVVQDVEEKSAQMDELSARMDVINKEQDKILAKQETDIDKLNRIIGRRIALREELPGVLALIQFLGAQEVLTAATAYVQAYINECTTDMIQKCETLFIAAVRSDLEMD